MMKFIGRLFRKSLHQRRVEKFMQKAGQKIPDQPTMPSDHGRKLRARLIVEEALETAEALGFHVTSDSPDVGPDNFKLVECGDPDLVGVIDGCIDTIVVSTGTLSACGIPDNPFQAEVDRNNLSKFGPGHWVDDSGKLHKPDGFVGPNIEEMLLRLRLESL